MRVWKPQPSTGRWAALVLLLLVSTGAIALMLNLSGPLSGPPETWPVNLALFSRVLLLIGLLLLAGALAYRTIAAFTLGYKLDRNGLYITWLGNRAIVPLDQIQTIDMGVSSELLPWRAIQGIGYYWGQSRTRDGRAVYMFATEPPEKSLAIHTPDAVYAISPADHTAFVQDLEQRRNLGSTKPLSSIVETGRMFQYAFWSDRMIRLLLAATFALNLLVLGILAARYPELSAMVEMRFNAEGQVAAMQPRHQVLFMPLAAFGVSLINIGLGLLLYRSQQIGARLLQGSSIIVQVLFGIAVITVIR